MKKIRNIILWTLLLALVAALTILPILARRRAEEQSGAVLTSAAAEYGQITRTLAGGGVLSADDPVEITVPGGVEITGYLIDDGQHVSAGTPVATVDTVTVMAEALKVQEAMDTLTEKLRQAANERGTATLTAAAPGRVKAVFVQSGDDVREAMLSYGCLAVISLDGLMAVEFDTAAPLRVGERVRVAVEGGKTYDGRVETILEGRAKVTLTDDGPALSAGATVSDRDGNNVGAGALTVHSPLRVMGESGTVNKILTRVGNKIGKGATLLSLKDMDPSAEYEGLSAQHEEYAATLRELFTLYRDGVVKAPGDGFVIDLDDSLVKNLRAGENDFRVALLDDAVPESLVPEGATNELVVVTAVQNGGCLLVSLGEVQLTDYADMSSVGVDLQGMNAATPRLFVGQAFVWDKEWKRYSPIQPGDVFLLARDSAGERLIFVRRVELPDIPTIPDIPSVPTQEEIEAEMRRRYNEIIGALPHGFSIPNFSMPQTQQEEELYAPEDVKLASLVPDNSMKISFPVDELDILQYAAGMEAEITVDALPGRSFRGTVTKIGSIGTSAGGNSKFTVTVSFDRLGDMLEGMNASVIVHTRSVSGLLIPAAALVDEGSRTYVYTGLDRSGAEPAERTEVTVGISDGERAEILSGLTEGQTVYYVYYGQPDSQPAA